MNIFKKLFRRPGKGEKPTGFKKLKKPDWQSFDELLEQNAGLSFEKQMKFGDVIGANSWHFDMNSGSISFGDELTFPVQVIGSLSFGDHSWMWGWANTQSGIPEPLLEQSYRLKKLGEEKQIKELTEDHFTVGEGFEHEIGMIACGLFKTKSYYCANYGQGTLVVTIDSDLIPEIEKDHLETVLTHFPELIRSIVINHHSALKNYLIDRGFRLKVEENKIEGLRNDKIIIGEFDEVGRLINLSGKI